MAKLLERPNRYMKSYRTKSHFEEFGGFWRVFSKWGDLSTPKRVNDEVSGIGNCKFEFSTIKNHYKDIHNNILDKSLKKQKWGVFSPKSPPGDANQSFPGVGGTTYAFITIVSVFWQSFRKI